MVSYLSWMPADLSDEDKDELAAQYPGDPHRAAAAAWELYAGGLTDEEGDGAVSVSTGSQSITFASPRGARYEAMARASWHRARSKPLSVPVGPTHEWGVTDEEDTGVIETFDSPPIPEIGASQFTVWTEDGPAVVGPEG